MPESWEGGGNRRPIAFPPRVQKNVGGHQRPGQVASSTLPLVAPVLFSFFPPSRGFGAGDIGAPGKVRFIKSAASEIPNLSGVTVIVTELLLIVADVFVLSFPGFLVAAFIV